MALTFILFLLLTILLDLCLFRPRRRRMKQRAILLNSIQPGSVVYTLDGVRGRVCSIQGPDLVLECMPDGRKLGFSLEGIGQVENYDEAAAKEKMRRKIERSRQRF